MAKSYHDPTHSTCTVLNMVAFSKIWCGKAMCCHSDNKFNSILYETTPLIWNINEGLLHCEIQSGKYCTICWILSMDAHKLVQEKKKLIMIILLLHCTTLKGMIPADYLGVDSPAHQEKKSREKKRRKVERNTNLSRSLDSLKELHGKQSSGMLKERLKIKICSKKMMQNILLSLLLIWWSLQQKT